MNNSDSETDKLLDFWESRRFFLSGIPPPWQLFFFLSFFSSFLDEERERERGASTFYYPFFLFYYYYFDVRDCLEGDNTPDGGVAACFCEPRLLL